MAVNFNVVRCVDVETTGLDPTKDDARVCELGFTDVVYSIANSVWDIDETFSTLVNPMGPIPPAMSGIHNITRDMVHDAPTFSNAMLMLLDDPTGVVLCAHNAAFERQFITTPAAWIDTFKVAVHLAPTAPDFKQGTLRYWLRLDVDPARALPAHRAGPDSYVCAALVKRMLAKLSIEEMIDISSRPAILPCLFFGMHAKKPMDEVPTGYLRWIVDEEKHEPFDEDTMATARYHLKKRQTQGSLDV